MNERGPESRVCPAKHGRFLVSGLRRLVQSPRKILGQYVREGQTVADLGCGPGYFTLPMAEMVGGSGRVIAVDLQPEMLEMLGKRARAAGLKSEIQLHQCGADAIGLKEQVDFALAFYMVHELPDAAAFFREVRGLLKPGGRLLVVEPKFHVTAEAFRKTEQLARAAGFERADGPRIILSRTALLS